MDPGASSDLIAALAVLAGLFASGGGALFLARRARAARRRQIEESEPRSISKRRPGLPELAEDLEADEEREPEDEAALAGQAESDRGQQSEEEPEEEQPEAERPLAPSAVPTPSASAMPRERPRGKPSEAEAAATAPESAARTDGKSAERAAFKRGLSRTRSTWVARLGEIFAGKKDIEPGLVEDIERVLLTADIGVRTAGRLLEDLRSSLSRQELRSTDAVWEFLHRRTADILTVEAPALDFGKARPFVLLVIGVNGTGKTTTIGKLAARFKAEGRKVLLAAGDTFRAAAVEQLEVWASRTQVPVVKGKEGADPSSVIFDAIKRGQAEGVDIVIADTAGRLHTKTDLMDELQKVRRVVGKAMEGAPHETWLVLDSTSGQNAIQQAQIFTQAMQVSGIVLTKLDGTAKGGVILGIADQLKIPVRYVGVGESAEDLRPFDAEAFVDALYDRGGQESERAAS